MNVLENFNNFDGYITDAFNIAMNKLPDYIPMFYRKTRSNRSIEVYQGLGNADVMSKWTGSVDYDTLSQEREVQVTYQKYSKGLKLEKEIFMFKNYAAVAQRVSNLAEMANYTIQLAGANTFSNAFNTSYLTTPESKAICATDHALGAENSDTQGNSGSYTLTVQGIDATRQKMLDFKDNRGNKLGRVGDCLIVGPENFMRAKKLVDGDKEPFTANNDINIYNNGEIKLLYNKYITGDVWFLADEMAMKQALMWMEWTTPSLQRDKEDFDTESVKYKVIAAYAPAVLDYRFIYGNQPS